MDEANDLDGGLGEVLDRKADGQPCVWDITMEGQQDRPRLMRRWAFEQMFGSRFD